MQVLPRPNHTTTTRVDNEAIKPPVEDDSFDTAVFVTPNTSLSLEGNGIATFNTSQLADGEESDLPRHQSPAPKSTALWLSCTSAWFRRTVTRRLRRARKADIERQAIAQMHMKKKKSPVMTRGRAQAEVVADEVVAEETVRILHAQSLVDSE